MRAQYEDVSQKCLVKHPGKFSIDNIANFASNHGYDVQTHGYLASVRYGIKMEKNGKIHIIYFEKRVTIGDVLECSAGLERIKRLFDSQGRPVYCAIISASEITEPLTSLGTTFGVNVWDENEFHQHLHI